MNEKDFKNCLNNTLNDNSGYKIIVEILAFCNYDGRITDSQRKDIFALGAAAVGNYILDKILEYAPEKYTQIVKDMKGLD